MASAGDELEPTDAPVEQTPPPVPDPPAAAGHAPMGELFELSPEDATDQKITDIVDRHIQWVLERHAVASGHTVVLLHKSTSLLRSDANRVYTSLAGADRSKPVLLVVSSPGGEIAPAYFIAKLCRQTTDGKVKVAVARQAKSAATLICCGADEIHMGGLSELGPIDPQFGQLPALALKHSVEHLAQLASQYPAAREMFSDYLSRTLNIQALGYYERVAESAKQYAERLLGSRRASALPAEIESIAQRLVYTYKDHGFVIDAAEAAQIFGGDVVITDSDEYKLANQLFTALDLIEWIVQHDFSRGFSCVGHGKATFVFQRSRA